MYYSCRTHVLLRWAHILFRWDAYIDPMWDPHNVYAGSIWNPRNLPVGPHTILVGSMWDTRTFYVGPVYYPGGTCIPFRWYCSWGLTYFQVGPTWDHSSIECVSLSFSKNYVSSIICKHKIYLIIYIYKNNN